MTLDKVLALNLPYTWRDVKTMTFDLLQAIEYLHSASIVHGNLNPTCIYCDKNGRLSYKTFPPAEGAHAPLKFAQHQTNLK
ncbi:hypothetical protein PFISCL1PPCAC_25462 [Pristionchus fissidentatus]|uniref:Protein kinase domain-containing protein n=1 Tax=Pristionchus fissidentatus TaxID=1538716 RepID=A0AAV5WU74_9BILA|nr:hypothetical protein PFISCL1PPCAC_25462 [Pristionchus fissidentatus]